MGYSAKSEPPSRRALAYIRRVVTFAFTDMNCRTYATTTYAHDLAAFGRAYFAILHSANRTTPVKKSKVIHILEGDTGGVAEALSRANIDDKVCFLSTLFLEGTLLAGVHAYDYRNYWKYVDALPFTVFVENYPSLAVRHPQAVLAAHSEWSATDLLILEECVCTLAREWAVAYDRLIANEKGAGENIVSALGEDPDLGWGAASIVPEDVAAAYMKGLRRAHPTTRRH